MSESKFHYREGWDVLLASFRQRPLFAQTPIILHEEPRLAVLRKSRPKQWGAGFLWLCCAAFIFASPYLVDWSDPPKQPQPQLPDAFPQMEPIEFPWTRFMRRNFDWIGPILGLGTLTAGIAVLARRDRIVVDARQGLAEFQWGFALFSQCVSIRLEPLRLQLRELHGDKFGFSAIVLASVYPGRDGEELQIAIAKWRNELLPMFTSLSALFEGHSSDETQTTAVSQGHVTAISRAPICTEVGRGRSRTVSIVGDCAILRASKLTSLFLIVFGVGLPISSFALTSEFTPPWSQIFILFLGSFVCAVAIYMWPRKVLLTRRDWLELPQCTVEGRIEDSIHGRDITAIQLCTTRGQGERIYRFQLPDFVAYQVNLVVSRIDCRVNLICDSNQERAEQAGQQLATLFGVPVLDHR